MNLRRNQKGLTLLEVLVATFAGVVILLGLAQLARQVIPFSHRIMVRQRTMSEARTSISLIAQFLRQGRAGTLVIQTPTTPPIVPNSQVDFAFQNPLPSGATQGRIGVKNGGLYLQERVLPGGGNQTERVIATNVTGLMFTGDYRDPALVSITLKIDKPLDSTTAEHPERVASILLANQTVRMTEAP